VAGGEWVRAGGRGQTWVDLGNSLSEEKSAFPGELQQRGRFSNLWGGLPAASGVSKKRRKPVSAAGKKAKERTTCARIETKRKRLKKVL